MSAREALLDEAKAAVTGSRTQQYAPPDKDFANIARMWEVIFHVKVTPAQVAMAMVALKISRLIHTSSHADSWIDIAGYAACGFEVTATESVSAAAVDYHQPSETNPDYQAYRSEVLNEDIKHRHFRP